MRGSPPAAGTGSGADLKKLVHELEVHQIELQMQNDELRRAHVEIEESRRKYAELYDLSPVGYMNINGKGVIREINLTGANMLGAGRSTLIGKPFSAFVARDSLKTFFAHLRECAQGGENAHAELSLNARGGGTLQVELVSAHADGPGRGGRLIRSIITDVTRRRRAEEKLTASERMVRDLRDAEARIAGLNEELQGSLKRLESLNRDLEAFNYSLAHDLNAPLRIIDGFARMIDKYYSERLDDEGRQFISTIRENALKMGTLIGALLKFSRLGEHRVQKEDIDMSRLANDVMRELSPLVSGRNVSFDIKALPRARGEKALMHQVFANLLANSIKFTRPKKNAVIEVGGGANGKENTYYVRDNGVGFDMKYSDRLFGVFKRLHTEKEFEGTGAGLAIVQRIIEKHGGRVWAEGKEGTGATLYFTLPNE